MIRQLISKHISKVDRLKKNMSYYEGKHKILDETKRENRLVCNHAKDISDTASSYFIGNPVTYKSEGDINLLQMHWSWPEQMRQTETTVWRHPSTAWLTNMSM